ncbi:MAG: DMT family transporter [Ruminococcaceae bacterium]|nr:DMT family transporter [Oscillospiraceae bacterium]
MKKRNMIKGYVLVILSAFLYGCMPLVTNYIYAEGINRESVVFLRNLLALPVLAALTWHQNRSLRISAKSLPVISLIALLGCCITPLLLYGSYQHIASGTATVFHFVYPAIVVLIGTVFLRKKLNSGMVIAIFLCVGGVCLFYNPAEPLDWTGCVLALSSGVVYAVYVVLLSVFQRKELSGFQLSFYIAIVCSCVMLAVCLLGNRLTLPSTATGWLLCILLSLMVSAGAVVMFQKGTFLIGGERASILSTVEPLTGVAMGVLVFHENISVGMGIGCVLVIAACILIAVFDKKNTPTPEQKSIDV